MSKKILLVEDEALIALSEAQMLKKYGYEVVTAYNGEKAVEMADNDSDISLILMDIDLGDGIDGTEAAEKILNKKDIPVVFLSSHTEPEVVEKTEKITSYGYVVKNSGATVIDASIKMAFKLFEAKNEAKKHEEALRESEATVRKRLKAITEPEGDIDTLELADIIDYEALQTMMEDFYKLSGMGGAILDISGKILVGVAWQEICLKFHRVHPDTQKNCLESDLELTKKVPVGTSRAYHCKNNMWDIVTPIVVDGKHLGNIFIGQFFKKTKFLITSCSEGRHGSMALMRRNTWQPLTGFLDSAGKRSTGP
jgi:CheY-like chemotaxis protein